MADTQLSLYTQLLIKILSNSIYEDDSVHPTHGRRRYRRELRETGHDWPAVAHSMVGITRLENLAELVQRALDDRVPGHFIETGVWRGGCCILMRGVLAANGVVDRNIYVADSFAGLPPPNAIEYPYDEGMHYDQYKELAISLDEVRTNFSRYGLLDQQVIFVEGWFSKTLRALEAGPFALIRLDGDLYESTYVALDALYPKVSAGGFVIIDDFNAIAACRAAVTDYRSSHGITAEMHRIDWTGVWWRKE